MLLYTSKRFKVFEISVIKRELVGFIVHLSMLSPWVGGWHMWDIWIFMHFLGSNLLLWGCQYQSTVIKCPAVGHKIWLLKPNLLLTLNSNMPILGRKMWVKFPRVGNQKAIKCPTYACLTSFLGLNIGA